MLLISHSSFHSFSSFTFLFFSFFFLFFSFFFFFTLFFSSHLRSPLLHFHPLNLFPSSMYSSHPSTHPPTPVNSARTARVLMLMVVPGHLLFMLIIFLMHQTSGFHFTPLFIFLYLFAALIQVLSWGFFGVFWVFLDSFKNLFLFFTIFLLFFFISFFSISTFLSHFSFHISIHSKPPHLILIVFPSAR